MKLEFIVKLILKSKEIIYQALPFILETKFPWKVHNITIILFAMIYYFIVFSDLKYFLKPLIHAVITALNYHSHKMIITISKPTIFLTLNYFGCFRTNCHLCYKHSANKKALFLPNSGFFTSFTES